MREKEEEFRGEKLEKEKMEENLKEVESRMRQMEATIHRREREKDDLVEEKSGQSKKWMSIRGTFLWILRY